MARIRSIKPEFWTSEQVMECSPLARLLFIGLWNFCDDAGNHPASARTIKAEIFPADDISTDDVSRLLDELSSNGLITLYTAQDKDFWHVTGWHHQKIDKPTYKYPEFSESARRTLDDSSPPEGKGEDRERIGRGEEVGKITETTTKAAVDNSKPVTYAPLPMAPDWTPSEQFDSLAKSAGLLLGERSPVEEMKEFRAYWLTQPNMRRTESEWDYAFIKHLKALAARGSGRSPPGRQTKSQVAANSLYEPDQKPQPGGRHAQLE